MPWRWNHIDGAAPELHLGDPVRPIVELKLAFDVLEIGPEDLGAGQAYELPIARAVIQMPMRVYYKE